MAGWTFADIWEALAGHQPGALAQVQMDRRFTWADFDRRANGIAATLLEAGAKQQDKVAQYLYSCPEYLESMYGCFKAGLVPVNTNYRYGDEELVYLWDNSDSIAVVFHGTFTPTIERIRHRVPNVRLWLWVDDASGPRPQWAIGYETAAGSSKDRVEAPWGRSGDDLVLMYTGGTTGMPKGVMWRQEDLIAALDGPNRVHLAPAQDAGLASVLERAARPGPTCLPAAPLMHGTGQFNALNILNLAGSVVTLAGRHFDAVELLDTIEREQVKTTFIVGDAFAKPILRALDADPKRWDISSLRVIISSGVMWSAETKQGLLRHNPRLLLVDSLGSSEAIGIGSSLASSEGTSATAAFKPSPGTKVIADDGTEVVPGSGEAGRVALPGRTPVGYYKDEVKSASTFLVYDGVRYSVPGDWATVEADGTITLLGRGSVCINTGGEKVYPEEVEEALKTHPAVHDSVVVGVPDERFGEAITAVVELAPATATDERELIDHVKQRLAHFKAPKRVIVVGSIERAANGKVDYKRWKKHAAETLGASK